MSRSDGDGEVLTLNPRFPSNDVAAPTHGPHSISAERRPDLCLTLSRGGTPTWLVLDAKYRVGRTHLGRAMASAHIYRDALRWKDAGGRARRACSPCTA